MKASEQKTSKSGAGEMDYVEKPKKLSKKKSKKLLLQKKKAALKQKKGVDEGNNLVKSETSIEAPLEINTGL